MFKKLRIIVLLLLLGVFAADAWLTKNRSTDWNDTLWAIIYPINGDQSEVTDSYLKALDVSTFTPLEPYFAEEAKAYSMQQSKPVSIHLGAPVSEPPPSPPIDRNTLKTMWWSLKLRYWSWRNNNFSGPADIKLYVIYRDPEQNEKLPHSLGLEKGLIGVIHAYADKQYEGKNNVVIAHELLHTLGATDKYDRATGLPIYPDGYAEPALTPRHPQQFAEIMGAVIPTGQGLTEMPGDLDQTLLGPKTAAEINW